MGLKKAIDILRDKKMGKKKETDKEPEKPKRGQYKERECPHCHKMVRNLGNHIKLKHPTEAPAPAELTKEDLIGVKTEKPAEIETWKTIYYCADCHAEVRKGEEKCWKCGETLNWDGVE